MLKRYQEFFKENDLKLLLKYDGLRDRKQYTARIFKRSKDGEIINYGKDIEDLKKEFINLLTEVGYTDSLDIEQDVYVVFREIEKLLIAHLSNEIILSLTIQYRDNDFEYKIVGLRNSNGKDCDFLRLKSNDLNCLLKEVVDFTM